VCPYSPLQQAQQDLVRVRRILDLLDYDFARFSLTDFVCWIEEKQANRKIVCVAKRLPPSLSGAWLAANEQDYVFFEKDTVKLHQTHIQLHELSHILLGHLPLLYHIDQACPVEFYQRDDSPPSLLRTNSSPALHAESEAELLATLIHLQIIGKVELSDICTVKEADPAWSIWQALVFLSSWLNEGMIGLSQVTQDHAGLLESVELAIYRTLIAILDVRRKLKDRFQCAGIAGSLAVGNQVFGYFGSSARCPEIASCVEMILETEYDTDYTTIVQRLCEVSHQVRLRYVELSGIDL